MLTEPDTMGVVSKAEDGCIRSDWPPRLLVAVGCPGGVGSRGFQKKRDLTHAHESHEESIEELIKQCAVRSGDGAMTDEARGARGRGQPIGP